MLFQSDLEVLFAHKLQGLNYPTDDIRWDLNYCQGSGASYAGKLDVKALGQRHCPEIDSRIWASIDNHIELEISRNSLHYVHENTLYLNYSTANLEHEDYESEFWGGVAQKVALSRLIPLVEEEMVSVSKDLARIGYLIDEMTPCSKELVRAYQTPTFRVEIYRGPSCTWTLEEIFEDQSLDETLLEIESKKVEVASFEVVVLMRDKQGEFTLTVGEYRVDGVAYDKTNPACMKNLIRNFASDAIHEARQFVKELKSTQLKAA